MTDIKYPYYFIDDFGNINKQSKGQDKDFAEIIELQDLIDDANSLVEELDKVQLYKRILDYAEKDMAESADWQAYCEKEFEGLQVKE